MTQVPRRRAVCSIAYLQNASARYVKPPLTPWWHDASSKRMNQIKNASFLEQRTKHGLLRVVVQLLTWQVPGKAQLYDYLLLTFYHHWDWSDLGPPQFNRICWSATYNSSVDLASKSTAENSQKTIHQPLETCNILQHPVTGHFEMVSRFGPWFQASLAVRSLQFTQVCDLQYVTCSNFQLRNFWEFWGPRQPQNRRLVSSITSAKKNQDDIRKVWLDFWDSWVWTWDVIWCDIQTEWLKHQIPWGCNWSY